jgi:beta-galactosidase/beta-glucuronidase
MSLRFLVVLAVLAMLVVGGLPAGASAAGLPQAVTLDQGWEYTRDAADQGLKAGWRNGNWDVDWQDIEVPHVFNAEPVDELFGGTIGWYRVRFTAPEVPAGWGFDLRFEGVRRVARVWLNGSQIGSNGNPYQPFALPARSIKPGVNELVVRVHNIKSAAVREGWWNWGGIVRPVHLEPRGPVHWDDVGLLSDVEQTSSGPKAIVRADGWIVNRSPATVSPSLSVKLTSPLAKVDSVKFVRVNNLKPGERRRVRFPMQINGQHELWSPRHPNLYTGVVEVRVGADLYQSDPRRTGLRYIRNHKGRLYLNEQRVQLRGASIQEDLPGRGPALRPEDAETIISDLKSVNANVTRAQYPLSEYLLSRFDEEGILVWSQAPVYHEDKLLATKRGYANALRKVRGTVLYARNHPSVMTHSVANELSPEPDLVPSTKRWLLDAAGIARDLDATVPASADLLSYPSIPAQEAYRRFGLLGINSYYGWYKGKPGKRSTAKLSQLAPYLRSMRRKYPEAAMMIAEFGAEATKDGPANVKETFAFQSRYLSRTLDIVDRFEWLSGAIYWTVREFAVKPNWQGGVDRPPEERDAIHNKGLLTYDGKPKPAFKVAEKRFGDVAPIVAGAAGRP